MRTTAAPRPARPALRGFTLVELMTGLAVGSMVVATALAALAVPLREAAAAQRTARAAEDLRAADLLMQRLLRQAVPSPVGGPAIEITDGGAGLYARVPHADGTVRGVAWRLTEGALATRHDGGAWQVLTDAREVHLRALHFELDPPAAVGPACPVGRPPAVRWRFEHRPAVGTGVAWSVVERQVQVRHRWPVAGCTP